MDGESVTVELPLFSTDVERRRYVRDHDPLPLPTLPKRKKKRPKTAGQLSQQSMDNLHDKSVQAAEKGSSLARTQIPGTIVGTIRIQMRWVPGMSARHRDVVYDAPRATRDAFQMWLFRQDTAPEIPHVSSIASDKTARTNSKTSGEWIDDELDELKAANDPSAREKEKLRVKKPGSASWIAHGMKVRPFSFVVEMRSPECATDRIQEDEEWRQEESSIRAAARNGEHQLILKF